MVFLQVHSPLPRHSLGKNCRGVLKSEDLHREALKNIDSVIGYSTPILLFFVIPYLNRRHCIDVAVSLPSAVIFR